LLVIEDEQAIGGALCHALREQGYEVVWAQDGATALQCAEEAPADLVLLDLGLPDIDGLDVCRKLRVDPNVPIVVVTARGDELDVVMGLDAGADDYVVKPFRLSELLARVRANLRTPASSDAVTIEAGRVVVDRAARRATVDGNALQLRPKEFDLLSILVAGNGTIVSRAEIMADVWSDAGKRTNTLEMHVSWLRRKLADQGLAADCITTVRGFGYRFDAA
jgi:DNA-binding response OmpR family regulator